MGVSCCAFAGVEVRGGVTGVRPVLKGDPGLHNASAGGLVVLAVLSVGGCSCWCCYCSPTVLVLLLLLLLVLL